MWKPLTLTNRIQQCIQKTHQPQSSGIYSKDERMFKYVQTIKNIPHINKRIPIDTEKASKVIQNSW